MKTPAYDKFDRPCKELYFMNLCFDVSLRSIDPSTKHGSVAVSQSGSVLSTGYNGPVSESIDDLVPLGRPEKYNYLLHSEDNLISNAAKQGTSLKDCSFYVTGIPCVICLQRIMNLDVKEIIYGPLCSKMTSTKKYLKMYNKIFSFSRKSIIIRPFNYVDELLILNPSVKERIKDSVKVELKLGI